MWYYAESGDRPETVDQVSSKKWVYVRRNIEEFEREDETDPTIKEKFYKWEEMKVSKDDWELYIMAERNTANIDYIAMMEDIELEEVDEDA